MTDPLDKLQTDPRPMPEFGGEIKPKGSPVGKCSLGEWAYAIFKPWGWHTLMIVLTFGGFALERIHANIGEFETKYGLWAGAAIAGLRGMSVTYQVTQLIKREDTRQVEIK